MRSMKIDRNFANDGDHAFLVDGRLWVIDVSSPSSPEEVGFLSTGESGVFVLGDYAFLAGGSGIGGLSIVRVSGIP